MIVDAEMDRVTIDGWFSREGPGAVKNHIVLMRLINCFAGMFRGPNQVFLWF